MAINVNWYDRNEAVIKIDFIGNWTLEEYYAAVPKTEKMIFESGKHIKCLLIDSSWGGVVPKNIMAGYKKVVINGKIPLVFVQIDTPSRMMIESLRKAYNGLRPVYFVNNLDEADKLIQSWDTRNMDES